MKKVKQTIVHNPETGDIGNCWTACIASIIECDIDEIPHFMRDSEYPITDTIKWLDDKGYSYIEFADKGLIEYAQMQYWGYHLICGPSPRFSNVYHSVVGYNGEPYFDPHPDETMLDSNTDNWIYIFIRKK